MMHSMSTPDERPARGRPKGSTRVTQITVKPGIFDRDTYSSKELGVILGVNFEFILDEINAGKLPAIKLGGSAGYRIRHEVVMRWLEEREREHQAELLRARGEAAAL